MPTPHAACQLAQTPAPLPPAPNTFSQLWPEALKTALLGTERQSRGLQTAPGPVQDWLGQLYPAGQVPASASSGEREAALLSAAALLLQYWQTSPAPAVVQHTSGQPTPLPENDLPLIPEAAQQQLRRILLHDELREHLLPVWLEAVRQREARIPPPLLVPLLQLAEDKRELRPRVSAAIGQHGHWLARQHPKWVHYLHHTPASEASSAQRETAWDYGNLTQRTQYLTALRQQDAAEGLALLQATWRSEDAKTRQELLAALASNLSTADEPWLEQCLDDRSKSVRETAAALLARLPQSDFSQRCTARLLQWLTLETPQGLVNKATRKKPQLHVAIPEAWDKSWLRDGIEEKPPQGMGSMGAKAWWLQQALATANPETLCSHWQISPDTLLALIDKHDWHAPLTAGLQSALLRVDNPEWAEAWLRWSNGCNLAQDIIDPAPLWLLLPQDKREALVLALVAQAKNFLKRLEALQDLLPQLDLRWSYSFSSQLLDLLHEAEKVFFSGEYRYTLHQRLFVAHLGPCLHADCMDTLLAQLPEAAREESAVRVMREMWAIRQAGL